MKKNKLTIKDIAKISNVGIATVSRVINNSGYVSDDVRQRIEQTIKENDFVPSQAAVTLKTERKGIIALLLPVSTVPFFSKFAFFVEQYLAKYRYKMIIINSQYDKQTEIDAFNMYKAKQIDGIIFVTHHIHDYDFGDMPLVTIDRHFQLDKPFVSSNNYESVKFAIQSLWDNGARRIGFIGGKTLVDSEVVKRHNAYIDFAKEHSMPVIEFYDYYKHGEEKEIANNFLSQNKNLDALIATSDLFALEAYYSAKKLSIAVPGQLQIIGYDGAIDEYLEIKISTIKQNIEGMASKAVEILLNVIAKKPIETENILNTIFIKGDTTKT